jgi:hypothetical protein
MVALAIPGGFLEPVWRLKPEAHRQFLQIVSNASIGLMVIVGAACGLASIGLARNARWGRALSMGILIVNLVGDSLNALLRHDSKTLIGLPIGGVMIWYLAKKRH